MQRAHRVTANIPEDLLAEAVKITKAGITETLVLGLRLIKRSGAYEKAQALKGKLNLEIDIGLSRERNHR